MRNKATYKKEKKYICICFKSISILFEHKFTFKLCKAYFFEKYTKLIFWLTRIDNRYL